MAVDRLRVDTGGEWKESTSKFAAALKLSFIGTYSTKFIIARFTLYTR